MSPTPDRLSAVELVRAAIRITEEHRDEHGRPREPGDCPGRAGQECALLEAAEVFLARLRNRVPG
nr:hypothetical protein [Micromonospora sp. DSM 115978]